MSYNQGMSGIRLGMLLDPRCLPGGAGVDFVPWRASGAAWRSAGDEGKTHEDTHAPNVAAQEAEPELKRPPLYKVVIVNDDYTPMEFVVEVLQTIFRIDRNKAVQIMLYVHTRGRGVAGVFTYEIAETKAAQVNEYARQHQHPLLCTLEEA